MKLSGNDLYYIEFLRNMHVARSQIECSLARVDIAQIDLGAHIARFQMMNQPLRPTKSNLGFGKARGIDLQLIGEITKLDRDVHLDFSDRAARHREPKADGQSKRNEFDRKVVDKDSTKPGRHGQSSLPERELAS